MKNVDNWVPLRLPKSNLHKEKHGQIVWDGKFIPLAQHLELNTKFLNETLNRLQITFDIEIIPIPGDLNRNSFSNLNVSSNGEAANILRTSKSVNRPKNWVLKNAEGNTWKLFIPFTDIYDYIRSKDAQKNNDEILSEYSEYLNELLRQVLPFLIIANVFSNENFNVFAQTTLDIAMHLGIYLVALKPFISVVMYTPELTLDFVLTISLIRQISLMITWFSGISVSKVTNNYQHTNHKHAVSEFEYSFHSFDDFPLKYLFPLKSMRFFTIPMILALTNTAQFIRPIASVPHSSEQTNHEQ